MQSTTAIEPSELGQEARGRVGHWAGLAVALALFAVGAVALESLPLAQGPPSPGALARSGQAQRGLSALPVAARGVVARTLGAHDRRWLAHEVEGGFVLGNRNAAMRASFSRRSAIVRSGTVSWSLGLHGYGYGARLRAVRPAPPTARANRVVYRRGGIAEWYAGGPAGVEQGFTLTRRPSGSRAGPLTLSIGRLPHGVTARVGADHRGLVLAAGGRDLLRYGNLFASDAHGRSLPARVELSGGSLRLLIDDRGAQYPLRVDPLVDVAKLTASGGGLGDQLGFSVAVSGDGSTAVAGAPAATVDSNANRGLVYVFTKPGGNWADIAQTATLDAFGGAGNDGLGSSVAISADGSKVVAGAPHSLSGSGAAYVFARPAGGWSGATEQLATLTASDAAANDLLGSSIAVSGDGSTVAAGAPEAAIGANAGQGAAYVFVQPGGGWGSGTQPQHQTAKLTVSDGAAHDSLGGDNGGNAIAVSGDGSTVAAGAATATTTTECFPPDPCTFVFGPGAVYAFVRPGGGWSNGTETAKLTASDGQENDRFGDAVAMSGDGSTIVAGAQLAVGSTGNSQQGAVYAFVRPGGGWSTGTETAKLTAHDGHGTDKLGRSVAVSSDASTIVAGAYFATVASNASQGKVYLFTRPGGGWTTGTDQGELTAADGAPSDELGFSVATASDGSTIVAGARFASPVQSLQGAAYVFATAPSFPSGPSPQLPPVGVSRGGGGGGTVGHASVSPPRFPAAPSGPSAQAARAFGTKVTFTLDQAASVRFTVQQPRHGRKGKHGKRFVTLKGSFTLAGRAGTNTFHFTGRLNGKRLAPGKYKLVATPKANGEIGKKATAGFTIIP
jgi:hypothetical protein